MIANAGSEFKVLAQNSNIFLESSVNRTRLSGSTRRPWALAMRVRVMTPSDPTAATSYPESREKRFQYPPELGFWICRVTLCAGLHEILRIEERAANRDAVPRSWVKASLTDKNETYHSRLVVVNADPN